MRGTVRITVLTKACERCEETFELPNLRESKARELVIQYTPCPHCFFVKSVEFVIYNKTGRCRGCSIPFALVNHHAKGRCKRCDMKLRRHEKGTVG